MERRGLEMKNGIFIDLDKGQKLPLLLLEQENIDIKNGKLIVKNTTLKNIDILSTEELKYIVTNLKGYIHLTITSQLDSAVGYLQEFGGEYTDTYIEALQIILKEVIILKKIVIFLERIRNLKPIGRPSICDFERIINLILSKSQDTEFKEGIKIYMSYQDNL